jgi:hypothetical protein
MPQFPTLIIGLGGSGIKSVVEFKELIIQNGKYDQDRIKLLGFDCNTEDIRKFTGPLVKTEINYYGLTDVSGQIKNPANIPYLNFVTMRSYPPNATLGANMYRQISRACFFSQLTKIHEMITEQLKALLKTETDGIIAQVDTVIVSSMCGGAGSGILIDVAVFVRHIYEENGIQGDVNAILVSGDVYSQFPTLRNSTQRLNANTYAVMKDLQKLQTDSFYKDHDFSIEYNSKLKIEITRKPLDIIFIIESHNRLGQLTITNIDKLTKFVSTSIYLMYCTDIHSRMKGDLMAPGAGFAAVHSEYEDKRVQRAWSSLGYFKLFYPRDELKSHLKYTLAKEIISAFHSQFFMDLTDAEKNDSRTWSQKRYLDRFIPQIVDTFNWEYEDFEKAIRHDVTEIVYSNNQMQENFEKIFAKEKWDSIVIKLEALEKTHCDRLGDIKKAVDNYIKGILVKFKNDLNNLPLNLLDRKIGVLYINDILTGLGKEFDKEEKEAREAFDKLIRERDIYERQLKSSKGAILQVHSGKPIVGGRSRLSELLPEFTTNLCSNLHHKVSEIILQGIIDLFGEIDKELNTRLNQTAGIVIKFNNTAKELDDKLNQAKIDMDFLYGKENHSEISIITKDKYHEILDQFLDSHKPDILMKQILITGEATEDYWNYSRKDSLQPAQITEKVLDKISPLLNEFDLSLYQAIDKFAIVTKDIQTRYNNETHIVSAQWLLDTRWLGLESVIHKFLTCPEELKTAFPDIDIVSSSPQNLEVLLLDCAMPPQAIQFTRNYKNHYDNEERKNPNSQHFIPEAAYWQDLVDFSDDTEVLKLFAVALAYGQIYEPTKGEIDCYTTRYKNKNYRGFIFTNKSWFILMPFYQLENGIPSISIANIEPFKLGQGRKNAYVTFKANTQYHEMIKKWIEDRIVGISNNELVTKLEDYQNIIYKHMSTTETELLELMKLESLVFDNYIKKVRETRDPTI